MLSGRFIAALALAGTAVAAAVELPRPGIGVFFKADEVAALREKVQKPPCKAIYEQILKQADAALAKWPEDKAKLRFDELVPKLPDIQTEFVPKEFLPDGGKEAGMALGNYAKEGAPAAAFVYLITGERKYADFAWEVFEQCAKANRWGWFPWSGSHMPQIHFGIMSRGLVLVADCVWDTLTPQQRQHAREVIADKCVEPYFRIVLQTPGMGLFHLRSHNQGSNALAAAVVGSVFVGDSLPDNRIWFNSLLQTFHWAITHDIGWMGQNLESGLGGYWSVSMQNLYTAAAALWNVRGIDLRPHPGFDQATWYPIIHETTVPAVNYFTDPIDPNATGTPGIISGKPIELPHGGRCGAWWLDYAAKFPDSPAHYFLHKEMVGPDRLTVADAHQGALGQVLGIAWWDDRLLAEPKPPTSLAQFTDRMAGIRSGYGLGQTYLYFNGDLFLSAKNEILCTTSGMSWHFPWHQYQISETGIETEGEPFAPSMVIKESYNDERFAWFRAESGFSNVAYYPRPGQRESHTHYDKRERSILYVRDPFVGMQVHLRDPVFRTRTREYFIFSDYVRHKEDKPRWHAWTWHLWNSTSNPKNCGRFVPVGDRAVRVERPNANLWIEFLTADNFAFEQHDVPAQPCVSYEMDHNGLMLRAIAGGYEATDAKPVTIPPSAWKGLAANLPRVPDPREVKLDDAPEVPEVIHLSPPPTEKTVTSDTVKGLTGGIRYRASLKCKEANYRVYEATAWEVSLELLDKDGKVIAKPETPYGHPDPLKLGAPKSDVKTHDWTETVSYFDAPVGAVACRATFRAVGSAHYFTLGELWLGPVEIKPMGTPRRTRDQRFLVLVMPLSKGAPPPRVVIRGRGAVQIGAPTDDRDVIDVRPDGKLSLDRVRDVVVAEEHHDRIVASYPDRDVPQPALKALATNPDANAKQLLAGLKPVLDQLAAERDAVTSKGRKNLALEAKVTASASRDERFPPEKVIDNQVAEYPLDGHLDYSLGIVWTSSRFAGYGSGKESLLDNRDYFPLYVRPTYWLLPEGKLGHIELELKKPAAVCFVRLLNTSNAGLNDFATHTFRVELLDADRKLLASKDGAFGKVFDRPFQHAFFAPKWFSRYTATFAGMLEPGVTVPFGDGWKEVVFGVNGVKFVRVAITKFWGIGGGLNEVQVYGQ